MFYESLFNPSIHRPVKACLTGAGEFGASFLFQAQGMPLLEVPAVCTRTVQRAVDAYENAGIPASKVRVCESAEDAKKAYADGFNVVVDSFEYIADLPLDVLVESSGAPEASAAAAELAIERGMHVVMVSKETDSVVGSILARKAAERGLVYTTGDGDQPSLLIGLISWGRVLGMNIVGAGKSSEYDFIYDPARDMVLCPGQKQEIATPGMGSLWQFGNRPAEEVVGKRRAMLTSLSHRSVPDLCEMAVVANATAPDCEGIVNLCVSGLTLEDGAMEAKDYAVRVAALLAALPLTRSATYVNLPEVVGCDALAEPDEAVDAGKLIIVPGREGYRLGRAVNSLTTLTPDKAAPFQKIKIVEGIDLIRGDIAKAFESGYVGKVLNDYDNKLLLVTAINAYLKGLEGDVLDKTADNRCFVSLSGQRSYLESRGTDTSEMKDTDILKANTGSQVFLEAKLTFCDAMEDLALVISM